MDDTWLYRGFGSSILNLHPFTRGLHDFSSINRRVMLLLSNG
jgi:hypothetical protein